MALSKCASPWARQHFIFKFLSSDNCPVSVEFRWARIGLWLSFFRLLLLRAALFCRHPFVTLRSKCRGHLSPFGHKCNCLERPFVAGLLAPTPRIRQSACLCTHFYNYLSSSSNCIAAKTKKGRADAKNFKFKFRN